MKEALYNWRYLLTISVISALGGLLFGYDWVVIGGAKPFYEPYFGISGNPALQGWVMSCALVGCLVGAILSGWLSDRYGRKRLLIVSAALFVAASIGTGAAGNLNTFILYRILGGIGIGLASNLSPVYIAELTPGNVRGRFVSINQLTIVTGILLAQLVNWSIARPVPDGASAAEIMMSWNGQTGWRLMFYACAVPAGIFFASMWFVPESPRWMARTEAGKAKARSVLQRIGGPGYANSELAEIVSTLTANNNTGRSGILLNPSTRKLLVLGIILAVFQQWCGINVIFNYAQEIFSNAGYEVSDILFNIVITGSVNLVFTFVGMFTVDKLGRKTLMLAGAGGLALIYLVVGLLYFLQIKGVVLLVMVVAVIACFAMTLGPVTWVLLSELFPNKVRGTLMAIATFSLWAACFVLTYTFPLLNNALGASGTFWLYGLICLAGFIYILLKLPETRQKSLEQIEKEFSGK